MKLNKIILLVVLVIIITGVLAWKFFIFPCNKIACTEEAKLCSDGSYTSRILPNCDFAPCPGEKEGTLISLPEVSYKEVLLYYYNPEKDKDESGNIKCSPDGLIAIEREIPVSKTPIQDVINLLLKGSENLTPEEINQGVTTEYPLEGFSLKGANLLEDGTLILEFNDLLNKTSGGSCRVGILWFQIEATAKQFSEVEKVQFLPEELFQP